MSACIKSITHIRSLILSPQSLTCLPRALSAAFPPRRRQSPPAPGSRSPRRRTPTCYEKIHKRRPQISSDFGPTFLATLVHTFGQSHSNSLPLVRTSFMDCPCRRPRGRPEGGGASAPRGHRTAGTAARSRRCPTRRGPHICSVRRME